MTAFIFISGLFSKKAVDQKNYRKVFEYLVLYIFIKVYLFLIKIVCGYGVAEVSLLAEGGVPWYVFSLAAYVLITICLRNIDKRYLFIFSIVLACFAGYDPNLGKELVLSRILVYYPFFWPGTAWTLLLSAGKSKAERQEPYCCCLALFLQLECGQE